MEEDYWIFRWKWLHLHSKENNFDLGYWLSSKDKRLWRTIITNTSWNANSSRRKTIWCYFGFKWSGFFREIDEEDLGGEIIYFSKEGGGLFYYKSLVLT